MNQNSKNKNLEKNTINNSSQISVSTERINQLRDILKITEDTETKYNVKKFLKNNGLDPAYMNFYKFIKEDTFPLPLLGFLKIIKANGFQLQLCVSKKDQPLDDSNVWEDLLLSIKAEVAANKATKVKKETMEEKDKKRENKIYDALNNDNELLDLKDLDISQIMDSLF